MWREERRARDDADAYWDGMVRRMVNLPRNILRDFSRAMDHGIDILNTSRGDRRQQMFPPPLYPPPSNPSSPLYPPSATFPPPQRNNPMVHDDEWAFLNTFEQQYGTTHPFFYACRFSDALKIAKDENKFLFLYLHSPEHPFTLPFCRDTLCSELVVAFLDANFVSWGGIYDRGEGLQLGSSLRAASFPFCAVIAPAASDDNIAVLQQIEGPVSPSELVEILQKTMEEQGMAFGGSRAKEEEKRRMDRRLREEQDAAYLAALKIDQEKEKMKKLPSEEKKVQKTPTTLTPPAAASKVYKEKPSIIKPSKVKDTTINIIPRGSNRKQDAGKGKDTTQILIRFPNGERRERSFSPTDKIQAIYNYIDSLGLAAGIGKYRLLSSFPKKVYGVDQMGMTLKDAGLHPRATLFLEQL